MIQNFSEIHSSNKVVFSFLLFFPVPLSRGLVLPRNKKNMNEQEEKKDRAVVQKNGSYEKKFGKISFIKTDTFFGGTYIDAGRRHPCGELI